MELTTIKDQYRCSKKISNLFFLSFEMLPRTKNAHMHLYPTIMKKRRGRFGMNVHPHHSCPFFGFSGKRLIFSLKICKYIRSRQVKITNIVKHFIQTRNNVTKVLVKPRSCDHGHRKSDGFAFRATETSHFPNSFKTITSLQKCFALKEILLEISFIKEMRTT